MKLVLDTNILVAALRSKTGASNPLMIAAFEKRFRWVCSVPLFWEYEDVLARAEFLLATGFTREEMADFLTDAASVITPVDLHFLWRPQLRDAKDEMVLETAVNGQADAIVTHNARDFGTTPQRFGLELLSPAEALTRIDR